jgi:hypothetical protein
VVCNKVTRFWCFPILKANQKITDYLTDSLIKLPCPDWVVENEGPSVWTPFQCKYDCSALSIYHQWELIVGVPVSTKEMFKFCYKGRVRLFEKNIVHFPCLPIKIDEGTFPFHYSSSWSLVSG